MIHDYEIWRDNESWRSIEQNEHDDIKENSN